MSLLASAFPVATCSLQSTPPPSGHSHPVPFAPSQLVRMYANAGGPEREASLRSMVSATTSMNTILQNRLYSRNVEIDRLKAKIRRMARNLEELQCAMEAAPGADSDSDTTEVGSGSESEGMQPASPVAAPPTPRVASPAAGDDDADKKRTPKGPPTRSTANAYVQCNIVTRTDEKPRRVVACATASTQTAPVSASAASATAAPVAVPSLRLRAAPVVLVLSTAVVSEGFFSPADGAAPLAMSTLSSSPKASAITTVSVPSPSAVLASTAPSDPAESDVDVSIMPPPSPEKPRDAGFKWTAGYEPTDVVRAARNDANCRWCVENGCCVAAVQVGYGTLLEQQQRSPSANKGFHFSSRLSRAEALARFRKRYQVPLEWVDVMSDPTQHHVRAGRLLTRSALHHLIWAVRVALLHRSVCVAVSRADVAGRRCADVC